jgi:hypothetical protein
MVAVAVLAIPRFRSWCTKNGWAHGDLGPAPMDENSALTKIYGIKILSAD